MWYSEEDMNDLESRMLRMERLVRVVRRGIGRVVDEIDQLGEETAETLPERVAAS